MKRLIAIMSMMLVMTLLIGSQAMATVIVTPTAMFECDYELDYEKGHILLTSDGAIIKDMDTLQVNEEIEFFHYEAVLEVASDEGMIEFARIKFPDMQAGPLVAEFDVSQDSNTYYEGHYELYIEEQKDPITEFKVALPSEGDDEKDFEPSLVSALVEIPIERSFETTPLLDYNMDKLNIQTVGGQALLLPLTITIPEHATSIQLREALVLEPYPNAAEKNSGLLDMDLKPLMVEQGENVFGVDLTSDENFKEGMNRLTLVCSNGFGSHGRSGVLTVKRFEADMSIDPLAERVNDTIQIQFMMDDLEDRGTDWLKLKQATPNIVRYLPVDLSFAYFKSVNLDNDQDVITDVETNLMKLEEATEMREAISQEPDIEDALNSTYVFTNNKLSDGNFYFKTSSTAKITYYLYCVDHDSIDGSVEDEAYGWVELGEQFTDSLRYGPKRLAFYDHGTLLSGPFKATGAQVLRTSPTVTFTIIPKEGYVANFYEVIEMTPNAPSGPPIMNATVQLIGTYETQQTITYNSDKKIEAHYYVRFEEKVEEVEEEPVDPQPASAPTVTYTLNVSATEGGTVPGFMGDNSFASGTHVNLNPTAEEGYIFDGWTGDTELMSGDVMILSRTAAITANFSEIPTQEEVEDTDLPQAGVGEDDKDLDQEENETEDILDESTPEAAGEDTIEDESLPQTGGFPLELFALCGTGLIGTGAYIRSRKK